MRKKGLVKKFFFLVSSQKRIPFGKGVSRISVGERVSYWLKEMKSIDSYSLKPISAHRRDYEMKVKKNPTSPEVFITDVGFGVSQVLPVVVLCYHMPKGSVILLEQPEIHLHPPVLQALDSEWWKFKTELEENRGRYVKMIKNWKPVKGFEVWK